MVNVCQSLSCLQHINSKAHDCIKDGEYCIFGDDAGSSDLGAGPVIGAVIDDQHLLALLAGQHVHQAQQKRPPVIPGILQELVGAIFLESQFPVTHDATGKVDSAKRQGENGGKHCQRLCPSQLADAATAQQGADLEIFQEEKEVAQFVRTVFPLF